jgi:hypothetical protein
MIPHFAARKTRQPALGILVRHPKKAFATIFANKRHHTLDQI